MAFEARVMVQRPNLAIGFLSFFGCVFLIALRAGWFMSFGILFKEAAALFDVGIPTGVFGKVRPFKPLGDFFRAVDNKMMRWLGEGISRTGHAFIEFLLWIAYTVTMIGVAIAAIGYELGLQGVKLIERTALPHIKPIVKTVTHEITSTVTRVRVIADSRIPALAREVSALEARLEHVAGRIALPAPHSIPQAIPRVGALGDAASWARHEINRLGRTLTPAGIIGLVGATFFGGFGLGWLRCRGVGRVGRTLCGLTGLIEAAAIDALTVFAAFDLCWFISGMTRLAENVRPLMLGFVDVENALLGRCGGVAPSPLVLSDMSHTPVVDGLTLKAL